MLYPKIIQVVSSHKIRQYLAALLLLSSYSAQASRIPAKPFRIIEGIDYLPFSYKKDGCYARAFYMSMELISRGIPTTNHYVFGKLRPADGIKWRYHVAPLVQSSDRGKFAVLDPSLSSRPLSPDYWVALSRPISQIQTYSAPASLFARSRVQERAQRGFKGYSNHIQFPRFEDIPSFQIQDIAKACQTAWNYIGQEPISPSHQNAKRAKLIKRTTLLSRKLIKQQKLNPGSRVINCQKASFVD